MTHVFIVNEQTFKVHLEYMFAGTGANCDAPFLENFEYQNPRKKQDGITSTTERNLAGMIADISRINPGDKIIFYLQASGAPGMFFGTFIADSIAFYDSNENNYLFDELGKNLNFRVMIKPLEIYSKGVSEYEALDSLKGINHPSEMCWSLIYRKLKGNRGCTMITDAESDRLISLIRSKNENVFLAGENFSYDINSKCIIQNNNSHTYMGVQESIDIKKRMLVKANRRVAFESHLQAYIVQNIKNDPLSELLELVSVDVWIGNEVSCGVGMQRIDIMTSYDNVDEVHINVIELKSVEAYKEIVEYQLPRYIDWIIDYIVPTYDKKVIITPIVLAKKFTSQTNLDLFMNECNSILPEDNESYEIKPITLISFSYDTEEISFEKTF